MSKKYLLIPSSFLIAFLIIFIVFSLVSKFNKLETKAEVLLEVNTSTPTLFQIPRLGINAKIEPVGITPLGLMDSPKGPSNVGWFKLGTPIGEIGSAVIDGHSGYKNNIPAVFDDLHKIKKGDKILVESTDGITMVFIVHDIKTYDKNAESTTVFSSNDGLAHLNLITCSGDWNVLEKTHSTRLIVFTTREL